MIIHDALRWGKKDILSKLDHWDMIAGDLDETTGITSEKVLQNRDALDLTDDILDLALDEHKDAIMEFINDKIWDYMIANKWFILESYEDLLK